MKKKVTLCRQSLVHLVLFICSAEVVNFERNIMANPLQEPALETPPGVISQFPTTHSDEQAWFYVCATLSTVFPGILLLLRLYTKLRVVRKVDLTDCSTTIFKISLSSRF